MEKQIEHRIFTERDFGFSVVNYHKNVGCEGVSITRWESVANEQEELDTLCFSVEEAEALYNALCEIDFGRG